MPEDEEAVRIVCLVKNDQPLVRAECGDAVRLSGCSRNGCGFIREDRDVGRGSAGGGRRAVRSHWSSLRRLTLERLIPAKRACSGEELTASESEAMPLPIPRGGRSQPFLPHYESTGSSCQYPPNTELCKRGLHQSAPSVCSPASCNGKRRKTAWRSLHPFISIILCPVTEEQQIPCGFL